MAIEYGAKDKDTAKNRTPKRQRGTAPIVYSATPWAESRVWYVTPAVMSIEHRYESTASVTPASLELFPYFTLTFSPRVQLKGQSGIPRPSFLGPFFLPGEFSLISPGTKIPGQVRGGRNYAPKGIP